MTLDDVKKSLTEVSDVYQKEYVLMVAINEAIQQNGWRNIEHNFNPHDYHFYYKKTESALKSITVKGTTMGSILKINFIGEREPHGKLEKLLDANIYELPKNFNVHRYVTDDMELVNEQELHNTICLIVGKLEKE